MNEKRNAMMNELDDSHSMHRLSGFNDRSSYSSGYNVSGNAGMVGGNNSYNNNNNNNSNINLNNNNNNSPMILRNSLMLSVTGMMARGRGPNDEIAASARLLSHIIEHGGLEMVQ